MQALGVACDEASDRSDHVVAPGPLTQALCWVHARRKFFVLADIAANGKRGKDAAPLSRGLAILKHTFNLSDEVLCERWVENRYFQYLCSEEFFRHALPFNL